MPLSIVVSDDARREFMTLPHRIQRQIKAKLERLAVNPSVADVKPLHGSLRGIMRARSGDYRIWFQVAGDSLRVARITNRKEGYD